MTNILRRGVVFAVIAGAFGILIINSAHAAQSYPSGTVFKETWGATSGAELCWAGGPTDCLQPWYLDSGPAQSIVTAPAGMPAGNALKMQILSTGNAPIVQTAGSFPAISTPADITFTLDVTSSSLGAYDGATFFCAGDVYIGGDCVYGNGTAYLNFVNNGSLAIQASGNSNTSNIPITLNTPHIIDLHIAGASSTLSVDGGTKYGFTAYANPVTLIEFGLGGGNQDPMTYYIGSDLTIAANGMNGSWPPSALMDWSGQSGTPTAASLAAGTHCGNAPAANWAPDTENGDASFTFASGSQPFGAPLSVCGSSYTGNSNTLLHMAVSTSTNGGGYEAADFNTAYSSASVGFYLRWNTITGVPLKNTDIFDLSSDYNSDTSVNLQLNNSNGNERLLLETDFAQGAGGNSSSSVINYSLASSTWYWITFDINASGTDSTNLYDTNGNLLGTANFVPPAAGFSPGNFTVDIGKSGDDAEPVPGYVDYSNILTDYADAQFPLLPPAAPAGPAINSFSAAPSMIQPGASSTLSWNVSNASSVTIMPGSLSTSTLVGSFAIAPTSTTTYTLTAVNGNGLTTNATATLLVDGTAPSVPTGLAANALSSSSVALSWGASTDTGGSGLAGYDVFRCTGASCTPVTQIGTSATSSYTDTGLATGTTYVYAVAAYDGVGNTSALSATATVTMPVPPPPAAINSFSVSSSSITAGSSTVLSWNVSNASSVAITPGNFSTSTLVGSLTIAPTSTTTYTLTAVSAGGNATAQVTVTVTAGPVTLAMDVVTSTDDNVAAKTIVSPSVSTAATNEVLFAMISAGPTSGITVSSISGGSLTWTLVQRMNAASGTAEIWRAVATAKLSNVKMTATLSASSLASMTIVSFTGASTSTPSGAHGGASASNGGSFAGFMTTKNGSWTIGVGNDPAASTARTPGTGQQIIHQDTGAAGNTFWTQYQTSPNPTAGTPALLGDSAPTADPWNMAAVEVMPQ